jgi:hypothetical protein
MFCLTHWSPRIKMVLRFARPGTVHNIAMCGQSLPALRILRSKDFAEKSR